MELPSLIDMLRAGVHFGHRTSKWHPNMEPFIYTIKNTVHIINLEKSQEKLREALQFIEELVAQQKVILFVGTKQQAAAIVKQHAAACGMPFVTARWIGGLFTNFQEVSNLTEKLKRLKRDRDSGALKKYTKKEQLEFSREIERLETIAGGIEHMTRLPDAVFIVDLKEEKTAVREARRIGIPIIAMVDTNVDPTLATYPIPANDDAVKSIELIVATVARSIIQVREQQRTHVATAEDNTSSEHDLIIE